MGNIFSFTKQDKDLLLPVKYVDVGMNDEHAQMLLLPPSESNSQSCSPVEATKEQFSNFDLQMI